MARTQFEHGPIVSPAAFKSPLYAAVRNPHDNVGKVFRRDVFTEADGAYSLVYRAALAIDAQGKQIKDPHGRDIFLYEGIAFRRKLESVPLREVHMDMAHSVVEPYFHEYMKFSRSDHHHAPSAFRYDDSKAIQFDPSDWSAADRIDHSKIGLDIEQHNTTAFSAKPDPSALGSDVRREAAEGVKGAAQKKSPPSRQGSTPFGKSSNWTQRVRSMQENYSTRSGNGLVMCLAGVTVVIGGVAAWSHFQNKRKEKSGIYDSQAMTP